MEPGSSPVPMMKPLNSGISPTGQERVTLTGSYPCGEWLCYQSRWSLDCLLFPTMRPSSSGISPTGQERWLPLQGHTHVVNWVCYWSLRWSLDRLLFRLMKPLNSGMLLTGQERVTLTGSYPCSELAVLISPDGAWIVSCSNDETLKLWDTSHGSRYVCYLTGSYPCSELAVLLQSPRWNLDCPCSRR